MASKEEFEKFMEKMKRRILFIQNLPISERQKEIEIDKVLELISTAYKFEFPYDEESEDEK